jgi:hypothetical protein
VQSEKLHDHMLPVSVEIWLYCSQMHLASHLFRSLSCPALSAVKISRSLPLIRPAAVMKGMQPSGTVGRSALCE